jgi:hypothetical protein
MVVVEVVGVGAVVFLAWKGRRRRRSAMMMLPPAAKRSNAIFFYVKAHRCLIWMHQ